MKQIRKIDLLKALFRAFYIQGTWNFERMMGLGLCFCLIPIARRLCKTDQEIADFLKRHLDFFNAQPYMASYAVGAITKLEEQAIRQKWNDKRPISVFKERICSPLGAIGDAFFWKFLKPFAACIGIILSLLIGWTGILLFLVVYNIPHFYVRIIGIFEGYRKGFDIIRTLSIRGTQRYFRIFNSILTGTIGILFISISYWIFREEQGLHGLFVFLIMTMVSYGLTKRKKLSIEMITFILLIISIIIGLII